MTGHALCDCAGESCRLRREVYRLRDLVRDLEGQLSVATGAEVSPSSDEPPTEQQILSRVAAEYSVRISDIRGKRRDQPVILARQVAMYLLRRMTDLSYPQIGRVLWRGHATVINGHGKIARLVAGDTAVRADVARISAALGRPGLVRGAKEGGEP